MSSRSLFDVSPGSASAHIYSGCAGSSPIRRFPTLLVIIERRGFTCVRRRSFILRALRYYGAPKAEDVPLTYWLIIVTVVFRFVVIHGICLPTEPQQAECHRLGHCRDPVPGIR